MDIGSFSDSTIIHRELELLLLCARPSRRQEEKNRILSLLQEDLDHEYLLSAAHGHGIVPLMYKFLDTAAAASVPGELRDSFHAACLRSLHLTRELLGLLGELQSHGIQALPYKGPTLAALAYGDLALRQFGDLDLLVREDDVLKARDLLTSLGYRPEYEMSRSQEKAFLRYGRECLYFREDGCVVELHWRLSQRYIPFSLEFRELWKRRQEVPVGGTLIRTLSTEDLFLALCVHGSTHLWERLIWVSDLARLLPYIEEKGWEELVYRAERTNARRMLFLGLYLTHEMLGAELPEEILLQAKADNKVMELSREVWKSYLGKKPPRGFLEGSAFRRFHFWMLEGLSDKLRYCANRITGPSVQDWSLMPLPARLFPLYRVLRTLRLGARFGRRLLR